MKRLFSVLAFLLLVVLMLQPQVSNLSNTSNVAARVNEYEGTGLTGSPWIDLLGPAPAGMYRLSAYTQITSDSAGACDVWSYAYWVYNGALQTRPLSYLGSAGGGAGLDLSDGSYAVFRADDASAISGQVTVGAPPLGDCTGLVYDHYEVLEKIR